MSEKKLTMGVFGSSFKENEYRLPIHPDHFLQIDPELRSRIYLEKGYGSKFGMHEAQVEGCAGFMEREDLFKKCDILLLPKPCEGDYPYFQDNKILWGWPHCVQGREITQAGVDHKMTYIAWEEMHQWRFSNHDGNPHWVVHTFHKNNELAGYCSVLHAMQLRGFTGHYGPQRRAAVISFGSTAQGACYALAAMGIQQIDVFKQRAAADLAYQIPTLQYRMFKPEEEGSRRAVAEDDNGESSFMGEVLGEYDIIVNCILQNTDKPLDFMEEEDLANLKPGTLIIDVSCDAGMGFPFAKPTSFEDPIFTVGDNVTYYAVDHSPSYLWDASTYEISTALLPYIPTVMAGPEAWEEDLTIKRAIEIQEGVIKNSKILSFQKRSAEYPHN